MRELKFRAYDKDLAKYLEGCEIGSLMAELDAEGEGRAVIIKQLCPARYIFEQYTELKDINGNEIYEGDIIRNIEEVAPNKSKTYQVFYKVDFAKFDVAPVDGKIDILSGGFNFASMAHYEVIGNIHENKELLEKE